MQLTFIFMAFIYLLSQGVMAAIKAVFNCIPDCSSFMCLFDMINFVDLFYYLAYFYYYLWVLLYFLVLFMGSTILFQLTFTFIYSTFNKKFSVSTKKANPKQIFNLEKLLSTKPTIIGIDNKILLYYLYMHLEKNLIFFSFVINQCVCIYIYLYQLSK